MSCWFESTLGTGYFPLRVPADPRSTRSGQVNVFSWLVAPKKLSRQETPNSGGGQKETRIVVVMMMTMTHMRAHTGEHIYESTEESTHVRAHIREHRGKHTYESTEESTHRRADI